MNSHVCSGGPVSFTATSNPEGMRHIQINCKLGRLTTGQLEPVLVKSDYVKTGAHGCGVEETQDLSRFFGF